MIENVDFTANTPGRMRMYQDLGPFTELLATELGQVGFQKVKSDGTYLVRVEPFSREAAEHLAARFDGWTQPDVCLTENRAFFSVVAEDEADCRRRLEQAVAGLLRSGEPVTLLAGVGDFNLRNG